MTPRKTKGIHNAHIPRCSITLEVPLLSSKVLDNSQVLDPSQHKLNNTVSRASSISRKFMSSQLNLVVSQTTLVAPVADNTSLAESAAVVLRMVRNVELLVLGIFLESPLSVPGGVLQGEQSAVGREDVV